MRTDCRICHSVHLDLILQLAPTPIGDQFLVEPKHQPLHPIDLYQCQDCGLAQLLYEIPPEEIYADYIYLTGSSPGLQQHFANYAKSVAPICDLRPNDLVVDIGSNDGTLLQQFRKLGMRVVGIEPAESIAKLARKNGIPTIQAYFHKGVLPEKAKLITANNVVANINDLDTFMEGVVDLLAEDGTFVFESFYLGDVVKNMVFDFVYHEHLSAFSIQPVRHLMKRYGLSLFRVEHLPTKGGSIRYYCNRYYARRGFAPVIYENEGYLYEKQTYVDFAKRIDAERTKTLEFCRQAKAEGNVIAGFGACISGTTLMYHFGLTDYIEYLLDDNPAKHGRYSPGSHLLVHPTGDISRLLPDFVLALAWRFADDFQAAHPDVKVIRPLPCFSIS